MLTALAMWYEKRRGEDGEEAKKESSTILLNFYKGEIVAMEKDKR